MLVNNDVTPLKSVCPGSLNYVGNRVNDTDAYLFI